MWVSIYVSLNGCCRTISPNEKTTVHSVWNQWNQRYSLSNQSVLVSNQTGTLSDVGDNTCKVLHINMCKSWTWFNSMHLYVNVCAKNAALENNRKAMVFINDLFQFTLIKKWTKVSVLPKSVVKDLSKCLYEQRSFVRES